MFPIHDPSAALQHHRNLIAERDRDRMVRSVRRQARARRMMRRADTLNRRAAELAERLV